MNTLGWILISTPIVLGLYAYLLYPLCLRVLPRTTTGVVTTTAFPLVSIVIPAYNEEAQIRGAIDALIAQDYPEDRRQILILSDASTDRTDEIVGQYAAAGVELLRMPTRGGKTAAENASCSLLRGEIIINSDSSIRMHPFAVRRLVEALADETVGVASSRDVSVSRDAQQGNATEAGYVGYEMQVRRLETLTGGIVGASGSGYAIRATLHRLPVRADLSRDFSAALTARTHGYTAVSVDDALCYVPRTVSLRAEYRRKVRTIARGVETLMHNRHLLNPIRFGLFSWKLMSHKITRWLLPPSVLFAVVGMIILAREESLARIALGVGLVAAAGAGVGSLWPQGRPMPRALSVVTFGVAANVAVIHALVRVMIGHEDHVWEPTRRASSEPQ